MVVLKRDNRFLGWADIDLTEEGKQEARKAAKILLDSDTTVDEVFCSYLKRSIKSAWILAAEMDQVSLIAGRPSWLLETYLVPFVAVCNRPLFDVSNRPTVAVCNCRPNPEAGLFFV